MLGGFVSCTEEEIVHDRKVVSVAEISGSAPNIRVGKKPNMLKDVKARYFVVQDYIMLRLFSISKLLF